MINLYQNDGKRELWQREGTARDLKHTTSTNGVGVCISANGTDSFVFIDVIADPSRRMSIGLCYLLGFSIMLQNALEGASQCRWIMRLKHTLKARSVKFPDLNPAVPESKT